MLRARRRWRGSGIVCPGMWVCVLRVKKVSCSWVLGLVSLGPAPPHREEPSLPSGRPTQDSLATSLPSLERSSAQGVSTVRRELSFSPPQSFLPCRAVPAAPCWLPRGRTPQIQFDGASGFASSSHLWLRTFYPTLSGEGRSEAPRGPAALRRHRDAEEAKGTTQPTGLGRVEPELVPLLQGVGRRALPSRRPRVWSWRSHQFSL